MKKIYLIYFLAIIFIQCKNIPKSYDANETQKWITNISGIKVPESARLIEFYPYIEYGKILKFQLEFEDKRKFIEEYNLESITSIKNKLVLIGEVEKDYYNISNLQFKEGVYFYLNDCKSKNTWNVLVNKISGELWLEMLYPDWSGDAAPCNKNGDTISNKK